MLNSRALSFLLAGETRPRPAERSRQWAGARPRRQRALPCGALPAAFLPSALRRSPHSSWFAGFFLPVRTAGGAQLRPGSSEMEVPPRSNTRCWRSTDLSHPAPSPQQLCRGTLQALRSWPRPIPVWGHRRHPRATPPWRPHVPPGAVTKRRTQHSGSVVFPFPSASTRAVLAASLHPSSRSHTAGSAVSRGRRPLASRAASKAGLFCSRRTQSSR